MSNTTTQVQFGGRFGCIFCPNKPRWRYAKVFLLCCAAFSFAVVGRASAQSPASVAGRTIQMTISSGTSPFASSGGFRFLPSALDSTYAIVPTSGSVLASSGTYNYSKTGDSTAALSLIDSVASSVTANCTFTTPSSGTYILTGASGGSQSGTFVLYSGVSPVSIAGYTITVTITSAATPFASSGSYQFLPALGGNTYTIVGLSGVANSSGTYAFSQNSMTTAYISYDDSLIGNGFSAQLSFDTATNGTVYLRKAGSNGYQTGLFTTVTTRWIIPNGASASGFTAYGGTGQASFAIDGNYGTTWTLNSMGYIDFDLGSSRRILGIDASWSGRTINGNNVNVYVDGIKVLTNNQFLASQNIRYFPAATGRIIRYETVALPNYYGQIADWSEIAEFRAFVELAAPPSTTVSIGRAVQVRWPTQINYFYQPQVSSNLSSWSDYGPLWTGDGTEKSFFYVTEAPEKTFFRVLPR